MSAPVLEVRLRLPLDRFDLDVDFVTGARVTGVFGPSGAGKTSLVESIAGVRRAATGRVVLHGDTWLDSARRICVPPEARRVGLVPQDFLLFPHLDVRGNLLTSRVRTEDRAGDLAAIVEVLDLAPLLHRDVAALSGGEKRRVALGRALCSAPRLLLLDEPLAGLDLPLQRRILPFLARVRARFPIPTLVVSHDPTTLQALCDDLVVLDQGTIRARGEPRRVLTDPAIFPLADARGFRNVVPCVVTARGPASWRVRLGEDGSGPELHVLPSGERTSGATLVSIPASDVIVAIAEPRGLSARNVVAAVVASVEAVGPARLVRCAVGAAIPEIAAELTADACAELDLVAGRRVHLIVKSAACALFGN